MSFLFNFILSKKYKWGVINISPVLETASPIKEEATKKKTSRAAAKKSSSAAKKTTAKSTKTTKSGAAKKSSSAAKKAPAKSSADGRTLIIVESPSKAATLSGMLGKSYVVKSSKGHMKDLPKSRLAIDIEHGFTPEYILVKGKAALKNELLKLASTAKNVLLASDPDREGEAIAWHLADILGV
ncbi:MAG: hypothetical protein IJM68_12625, partial [Synergistaceae bacterium]|nr:hypothetical protein [Synergistaceae bacterium]